MPSVALKAVRTILRRAGLDVVRFEERSAPVRHRLRLIREHDVDLVLDIGANAGQYARALRAGGYRGRIVSFEPHPSAYAALAAAAVDDPFWETRPTAVGVGATRATLNVSANTWSSSLLRIADRHRVSAPAAATVGEEDVEVVALGALDEDLGGGSLLLKADVQGSELAVLEGAGTLLDRVHVVDVELSLVPLYEGQPLLPELLTWLSGRGFEPVALEHEFTEPKTGVLLQLNGLFVRNPS